MSKRNDLIIEFIDNLFNTEADLMSHILGCLIDYLIISEFDFKTDDITKQKKRWGYIKKFHRMVFSTRWRYYIWLKC